MTGIPENDASDSHSGALPAAASGATPARTDAGTPSPLWGFRDGALLCLCADPHTIPEWAPIRYSFASPSELVFAAHYVPLVRTLAGDTVEGGSFTSHDAAREFRALRRNPG
jgi:hypothetical protein